LPWLTGPRCQTCGFPFAGFAAVDARCPHCHELTPVFSRGLTIWRHEGAAANFVRTLKYRDGRYLVEDLPQVWAGCPELTAHVADAHVVPVPLHPVRLRARGFNQSALLAENLVENYPGTTYAPVLHRIKATRTQTRLQRKARQLNVKNAFALGPKAHIVPGKIYLLVDDVFTTGATLNAAAQALLQAGAAEVRVLALAHG